MIEADKEVEEIKVAYEEGYKKNQVDLDVLKL